MGIFGSRLAGSVLCLLAVLWAGAAWAQAEAAKKMPDLTGMSQDEAQATLWALGLRGVSFIRTDREPADPAMTGMVKSQSPTAGTVVNRDTAIKVTIWAGCNQVIGALSRTNPKTKRRECYCPPNMAVFYWHEGGPKCTECWVHLRYLFRWINERDWRRAQMIVSRAKACKWHGDGVKLLKAAKEFYSE